MTTTPSLFASCRAPDPVPDALPTDVIDPMPEPMELWRAYFEERSVATRNRLVEHFMPLARLHARRMCQRAERGRQEELLGAAAEGLIAAVERFDPRFRCGFPTYASRWIVGAIQDFLRDTDVQTRTTRVFGRAQDEAWQLASSDVGRNAPDEEVARRMGLSAEAYARLCARRRATECLSLDVRPQPTASRHERSAWDIADPHGASPSQSVEREWLCDYLCRGLTSTQRHILMLYYYEGLTMAEIGRALRLCEARISQIHHYVLGLLAERFRHDEARWRLTG